MKKIFLTTLLSLSVSASDYFISVQNDLRDIRKILYSNNGANYFVDEFVQSAITLNFGLESNSSVYGLYLSKEYLQNDSYYGVGFLYQPKLYGEPFLDKYFYNIYLDTSLGYNYKSINDNRANTSGFLGEFGVGVDVNYKNHTLFTSIGFGMDYSFTSSNEFAQSQEYIYYGFYNKFGYRYRF